MGKMWKIFMKIIKPPPAAKTTTETTGLDKNLTTLCCRSGLINTRIAVGREISVGGMASCRR